MKKLCLLLLLATLSLLLTSCIEFERQDIWFRYDQKADVLRIFSLYKGIFAEKEKLSEAEKGELRSVMAGGRTFFFSNWITEYHERSFKENLAKMSSNAEDAEEIAVEYEKTSKAVTIEEYRKSWLNAKKADVSFLSLLLDNVSIRNGKFFVDDQEKLSGWQFVEVKQASKVLTASNQAINLHLAIFPQDDISQDLSPESAALWGKAGKENHQWLSFDRGSLTVRIPLTQEDFVKNKQDLGKEIARSEKSDVKGKVGSILESDWWVAWGNNEAIFNLGFPCQDVNHLGMPVFPGYKPNIVEWVRSEYGVIDKAPDLKALADDFLISGKVPAEFVTESIPEKKNKGAIPPN